MAINSSIFKKKAQIRSPILQYNDFQSTLQFSSYAGFLPARCSSYLAAVVGILLQFVVQHQQDDIFTE